ncbi:MAG: hypothetical protein MUC91_14765 [Verrucomicrobia bacterium]|nr:hypothetical protein [Verrucomicrobiota bacterium]
MDYFKEWPETAAFGRAAAVDACQLERQTPISLGMTLGDMIRSPLNAWARLLNYRRELAYRRGGSYEDEAALLLHYRDRELELRRAVLSPSWSDMRTLPGVTNLVAFQSQHSSRLLAPDRTHPRIFEGTTTNGVIQARWNLIDGQGMRFTNESFRVRFHLTRPEDHETTPARTSP